VPEAVGPASATVAGRTEAWVAGGCTLLALAAFWYLMPLLGRGDKDNAY